MPSGRFVLDPAYMRDKNGNLHIIEISIVPEEWVQDGGRRVYVAMPHDNDLDFTLPRNASSLLDNPLNNKIDAA